MESFKVLVKASRPVGWSFGPILYAIGLVHSPEHFTSVLRGPTVLLQLLSVSVPLSIIVFGMNDVYDYETDIRNPRKTVDGLEGTILDPSYHVTVITSAWIATALILATSLSMVRRQNAVVVAMLLVLSWQYSAPPFRLKEQPILDSLSNGAIIDFVYLAGYTAGGGSLDRRMLTLKGHILGLCTAGVHALGAVVDVDADAAVGQRTIATVFGPQIALVFGATSYLFALLIERHLSIFGVYLLGGLLVMVAPIVDPSLAHAAFQAVVYWTGAMSAIWFADKASAAARRHLRSTHEKSI
ncbi:hypothetical protein L227DRAFT_610902 [Lentinus tigrinus ALCF2SS1-6]|uniref:UbiA prenyltransferase n=1 Tax=Lentinus tigrinus ALCF2SS1-6 TaxID=1328759 RepID=A0A5C2SCG3_9APHY|nr:hypothetical protein L227DRAFT_610902 [Lentinus tigrinus ALCF2SS1-6]